MNKLKIFYYSPAIVPSKKINAYFSTPVLYLNSYLKAYHPELIDEIEWKKLEFFFLPKDELIKKIKELDIDILCVSLYIWNSTKTLENLKNIKRDIGKDIKIIVGGPSVDIVRNKRFLDDNPDIDFVVYSQGEKAFKDILSHIKGDTKLSLLTSKNVAWRDSSGKTKIADFEFLRLDRLSPYLLSIDLIKKTVEDPYYDGIDFIMSYETSKGCPYNCSFCDWTSGLTHKSYFRKFDPEQELDELGKLGITTLYLGDANFGQHKQDIETAKTLARLKKEKGYNFTIVSSNFSKLQKKRAFEITDILIEAGLVDLTMVKFAVQDIHDFILTNIERPDIPWEEHRRYIDECHKKFPHISFGVELIQGLPGQTRETWEENLIQTQPYFPQIYFWSVLPNSPAGYDTDYKNKTKLRSIKSNLPFVVNPAMDNDSYSDIIIETMSYTFNDYAYMTLLTLIFTSPGIRNVMLTTNRGEIINLVKSSPDLETVVNQIETYIKTCDATKIIPLVSSFVRQILIDNYKTIDKDLLSKFTKFISKKDPI